MVRIAVLCAFRMAVSVAAAGGWLACAPGTAGNGRSVTPGLPASGERGSAADGSEPAGPDSRACAAGLLKLADRTAAAELRPGECLDDLASCLDDRGGIAEGEGEDAETLELVVVPCREAQEAAQRILAAGRGNAALVTVRVESTVGFG